MDFVCFILYCFIVLFFTVLLARFYKRDLAAKININGNCYLGLCVETAWIDRGQTEYFHSGCENCSSCLFGRETVHYKNLITGIMFWRNVRLHSAGFDILLCLCNLCVPHALTPRTNPLLSRLCSVLTPVCPGTLSAILCVSVILRYACSVWLSTGVVFPFISRWTSSPKNKCRNRPFQRRTTQDFVGSATAVCECIWSSKRKLTGGESDLYCHLRPRWLSINSFPGSAALGVSTLPVRGLQKRLWKFTDSSCPFCERVSS